MQQPQHLPREGDRPAADRREHLHMLNKLGLTLFTAAPNLRPAARSALVIDPSPEDRTYCKVVIIWDDPPLDLSPVKYGQPRRKFAV
jgi:hypothetical protein